MNSGEIEIQEKTKLTRRREKSQKIDPTQREPEGKQKTEEAGGSTADKQTMPPAIQLIRSCSTPYYQSLSLSLIAQ